MDERARAIQILKQTREALARRLTERILEAEEEILAEAEGETYLSEIETIYDQIGIRLAHVNQMLAHLPAAAEAATATQRTATPATDSSPSRNDAPVADDDSTALASENAVSTLLALPPPGQSRSAVVSTATLLLFATQVRRGDWHLAAASLETLFGLNRDRSRTSVHCFATHCERDPAYLENAARLHNYLQADALSRAFGLMCESFGLSGGEALSALLWWRTRAGR
jgi:hypothetical protein